MTSELVALLGGQDIGRVRRDARGRITFAYSSEWREAADAYPLSLSMPLAARDDGPAAIEAFLWGLLPDNELVLERWASKFQVSPRNVFAHICLGLARSLGLPAASCASARKPPSSSMMTSPPSSMLSPSIG